ncbi:D-2-hydroxyacid dehydrogenase family protein [uncultured Jatrophihabitans sp.]|uniref:D-2-hydroxyacid dehydrogenase family protein n=1 Tax=uncultured Jatrophihabitans sp. TaxID=1610747 RepID=UPI0035CB1A58
MPTIRRIALLDDFQDVGTSVADWSQLGDVEVVAFTDHLADPDALVEAVADFDAVVAMRERTPLTADLFDRLPRLRLIVSTGPGNVAIDVGAANEHGITVCGTGGVSDNSATVEMAWALILATARSVAAEDARLRAGGWQQTVGRDLAGHRLGVIGLGGIGGPVARIGLAFGMDVVAWSEHLDPDAAREQGVTPVDRDELLRTSDVVTIHLKLSDRTRGLIGAEQLGLMKPDAILVNTSRGPIVDEDALLEALQRGSIGGAGLDVYSVEPLAADSPWRDAPRTVLTPHLGYVTEDTLTAMYRDAVEDVAAYERGEPVRVFEVEQGSGR